MARSPNRYPPTGAMSLDYLRTPITSRIVTMDTARRLPSRTRRPARSVDRRRPGRPGRGTAPQEAGRCRADRRAGPTPGRTRPRPRGQHRSISQLSVKFITLSNIDQLKIRPHEARVASIPPMEVVHLLAWARTWRPAATTLDSD